MRDMTGLDDGFPVIGEMPRCSDTRVCKTIREFHAAIMRETD